MSASHRRFKIDEFISLARKTGTDTQRVEVKTAKEKLPKDVAETLSAFANGSGGVLVCGLSEKDGFTPIEGFAARPIADAIAQVCSEKMEPPIRCDIEITDFEGSPTVVAYIPETQPFLKPCYVKARSLYDGSFIRSGDGDRHLSRYEVDRMLENRTQPRFDAEVIPDAEMSEFDERLVSNFLERERANSPHVFASLSDEEALLSMRAIADDGTGKLRPTLAGIMAFALHPQRHFPRANVTFAVFAGNSKADASAGTQRFVDSRTIIGSIPVMIAETLASVRRNMKVASFVQGAFRTDVPDYPEAAIREAVANALMHRDYSPEGVASQIQVNMYSNRIEILNPGGLFGTVTVENLGTYGASASRNTFLSRILESTSYPTGYPETGYVVENKGTGYAQIQSCLLDAGMEPAEPQDELSFFRLTIMKRGESSDVVQPQPAIHLYGSAGRNAVLEYLNTAGPSKTSDIASALGVSAPTARRRLAELVDQGSVVRIGEKNSPSVRYSLP